MNLYLIGPVTGIEYNNRPEFERVRAIMESSKKDLAVTIPHDFINQEKCRWDVAMRLSFLNMLKSSEIYQDCTFYSGIALLDGWEQSRGARLERYLATELSFKTKPWQEWLEAKR